MKTVTYLRAYLLNSTSAKVELALKDEAKNIRLQGELIKKLEKVNNSEVRYELKKAQKYNDQLTALRGGKYMFRALDSAENPVTPASGTHGITKPRLSPDIISIMSSPEQVNLKIDQTRHHLDAILACTDRDAVNAQNKMRMVTTNLQYLSNFNTSAEDKKNAHALLHHSVADKDFCIFGNNNIDTDVQYDAVMAHLSTIKSWLDKNN